MRRRAFDVATLCVAVVWFGALAGPVHADSYPLAFVQTPRSSTPATADLARSILAPRYRQNMRIVLADSGDVAGTMRVVTEGFATATDPQFRFDGRSMVFAGHRTSDKPLQVWELSTLDARPFRRFAVDGDCVSPSFLPDGSTLFASLFANEYEEQGRLVSFSLFAQRSEGDTPTRLTFNPSSDFDPLVLSDGRVLYSSWQHVGNHHWPAGTMALMVINADGTGVFPLTGNHRGDWLKRGAVAVGSDEIVYIQAYTFGDFGAGELVATSFDNPFADYRTLVPIDRYAVADVATLPDGRLLLSARPSNQPSATFGLYVYDHGEVTLFYDDPNYHELAPAVGAKRPASDRRISTVVEDEPSGYVAILNCFATDRTDQHALRPGGVRAVRVIEGRPLKYDQGEIAFLAAPGREAEPLAHPASATGYIPSTILGEVSPAADGSVYVKVPADRPLRFQLIDRDGFAVINERAWFWVRPNERRVCIGCHEDRELSPPNKAAAALRRPVVDLTDPASWRTVSFRHDIQPIVSKTCAVSGCHVPPTPTAGMNLSQISLNHPHDAPLSDVFGPTYANLLARRANKPMSVGGRRIHPGDARSSPLLWMLYGRPLAKQYAPAPFERPMIEPHPGPPLPAAELELIRTWVDLGAPFDDVAAPGRWPHRDLATDAIALEHDSHGRTNN